MTDYREADFSHLKTVPIAQRSNRVEPALLAHPPGPDRSFAAFWSALPDILAARDLRLVVDQTAQPLAHELASGTADDVADEQKADHG